VFGQKNAPKQGASLPGDGLRATRWVGPGANDFKEMACLHDLCEYRTCKPPKCSPAMRVLFRIRWSDESIMPGALVKFTSKSWRTTGNFYGETKEKQPDGSISIKKSGFFGYIDEVASKLGIKNYSLFGYPFVMTLTEQTKPSENSRFPVTVISPEVDPIEFFARQREKIKQISDYMPTMITDDSEQNPAVIYGDVKSISLGVE